MTTGQTPRTSSGSLAPRHLVPGRGHRSRGREAGAQGSSPAGRDTRAPESPLRPVLAQWPQHRQHLPSVPRPGVLCPRGGTRTRAPSHLLAISTGASRFFVGKHKSSLGCGNRKARRNTEEPGVLSWRRPPPEEGRRGVRLGPPGTCGPTPGLGRAGRHLIRVRASGRWAARNETQQGRLLDAATGGRT